MNRSEIKKFLQNQGLNNQEVSKILSRVKTIEDFILLVPEYGDVLKRLIINLVFGFKKYSNKAYDENVWVLMSGESDIPKLTKLSKMLNQPANNRKKALINYYVNECNQGVCETSKLKSFLEKHGEVLDFNEPVYTSDELKEVLFNIKFLL